MSKQHFEWAASHIRRMAADGETFDVIEGAREGFIAMFRRFGPRFNEDRFRAACVEGHAVKRAAR